MKDVMIHIERIVRPVRASQSRKLRMRRELLAHMQSAMAEECAKGADDATAFERATQRLGDPAQLTGDLQSSVPLVERVLMARAPKRVTLWEKHVAERMNMYMLIKFSHWLMLNSAGAISVTIVWSLAPHLRPENAVQFFMGAIDHPVRERLVLVCIWLMAIIYSLTGLRFLATTALPSEKFNLRLVLNSGLLMVVSLAAVIALEVTQMGMRRLTVGEIARPVAAAIVLAVLCIPVGRRVAALRRPYDEWLSLDIGPLA